MNHSSRMPQVHRCVSAILAGLMLPIAPGVRMFAQDAPENNTAAPQAAPGPASAFNWHDIPVNENIPIQRASFDAGGYQLVDIQGQTIVVPFENSSLYVMKFAQSTNGTMYFVNDGAPILYVPQGAGLYNLTVVNAVWYPPAPVYPVYYGIAPNWDTYVAMGWYPGMHYSGGYWYSRGVYVATPGLYVEIGGTRFVGWTQYDHYYHMHGGWRHVAYLNKVVYPRERSRRVDYHDGRGVPTGSRYGGHHPDAAPSAGIKWAPHPQGNQLHAGGGGAVQPGSTTVNGRNAAPFNGHEGRTTLPGGYHPPTPNMGAGTTPPGGYHPPTFNSGGTTGGAGSNHPPTSNPGSGSASRSAKPTGNSNGSGGSGGTKKH